MSSVRQATVETDRYAKCVEVSKRIRWDTDRDVIRGRGFDFAKKFLPDGLSKVAQLPFLGAAEKRFFSQVQGRTYANMFALVERFIGAKMTEIGGEHALGDQVAFEALVRLTDEELKHQEESQHAIIDEMEWARENERLDAAQRDKAIDDLIGLVGAVDGICQMQAKADAGYFVRAAGRAFEPGQAQAIEATMLAR